MKRLFKKGTDLQILCSRTSYNFSNLPRIVVVKVGQDAKAHEVIRTVPTLPYDLIVYHCRGKLPPSQVPLMFELHRFVGGAVLLFHHSRGKRFRSAMRLVGFKRCTDYDLDPISVWGSFLDGFELPRCKTERPLEEQPKRFYRALLKGTKHVFELFPEEGVISKTALELGIPVTLFLSERDDISTVVEKFGGTFR